MRRFAKILLVAAITFAGPSWTIAQDAQNSGKPPAQAQPQAAPQAEAAAYKEVDVSAGSFSRGEATPDWVEDLPMPAADANAAVAGRLYDTQFMVGDTPISFTRFALTVNDVSMLTTVGQISIGFVPQYQKLKLHYVRVLRGTETLDRTSSSSVRFLQRETGLEKGVYTDVVTASVLVNDLRAGDTLEYAYSRHGENPVFGHRFSDNANWDMPYKTSVRRVILSYPDNKTIAWRVIGDQGGNELKPVESQQAGLRRLQFEERDLPEVTADQGAPSDTMPYRWLHFSEYGSWKEVADWARDLFVVKDDSDPELQALIFSLKQAASDDERVSKALGFVQSEIRYFSVSLGESSHRPTQPGLVLKQRYGDCKDKSLLLITILKALGVESHPVLLSLSRRKALDTSLPSPVVFDHAIVQAKLNGKTYYLDPTRLGQYGKLDKLGQVHEGSQVLVVTDSAGELATVASPNAGELARSEMTETVRFREINGDAELKSRQVWKGAAAEGMRTGLHLASRERIAKSFTDAMDSRYTGARLVGEPVIEDDRENNVFVITTDFTLPKPMSQVDDYWYLRFSPSNLAGALVQAPSSQRKAPLAVSQFPFESKYTIEVEFPKSVNVTTSPYVHSVKSKYFTYNANATFRGNVAKTTVSLKTLTDRVPASDLKQYGKDLEETNKNIGGVVVLPKRYARSKKIASKKEPKTAYAETLRGQTKDSIGRFTETIKTGGLNGEDLSNVYSERSQRQLLLGKMTEASADIEKALKLEPNAPRATASRGEVHFHKGEFDKAIEDYSLALALGDTSGQLYQARGIAKFYAGKLPEAATDLVQASPKLDQEARLVCDAWLAVIYLRLGAPMPADLAERVGAEPRGEWPRPVLATLAGKVKPEDLLKAIEKRQGDDAAAAQAQGYFFLAQYHLAKGDKAQARDLFDKARKLEIITQREHVAAGHELKILPEEAPAAVAAVDAAPAGQGAPVPAAGSNIATGTVGAQEPRGPTGPAGAAAAGPGTEVPKAPKRKKRKPENNATWNPFGF